MDISTIQQAISNNGFPIVMCLAMAFIIYKMWERQRQEVKELTQSHKEEIDKLTEAVNKQTLSIQRLVERIDRMLGGAK